MPAAMLTSKGQITIPQAVRVALGLHAGTRRTGKVLAQKLLIQAQQIQRDRQTRPVNAIVLPGCGMVITDHPLATGRVTGAFVGGYGLAAPIKPQDKQNGGSSAESVGSF